MTPCTKRNVILLLLRTYLFFWYSGISSQTLLLSTTCRWLIVGCRVIDTAQLFVSPVLDYYKYNRILVLPQCSAYSTTTTTVKLFYRYHFVAQKYIKWSNKWMASRKKRGDLSQSWVLIVVWYFRIFGAFCKEQRRPPERDPTVRREYCLAALGMTCSTVDNCIVKKVRSYNNYYY